MKKVVRGEFQIPTWLMSFHCNLFHCHHTTLFSPSSFLIELDSTVHRWRRSHRRLASRHAFMTLGDLLGPETESCGRDDTVQGLSQRGVFPFERVCIHFEWLAKNIKEFLSYASVRNERLGKFEPRPPAHAIYEAAMRVSNYRSNVRGV